MPTQVTLTTTADGRLAVRKIHHTPAAAKAEAMWLALARHRGVVRLIEHHDEPPTTLTEHLAGPTLRTADLDHRTAATVLLSVAVTIADLHDRGITHGALGPDHVIVGGAGGILCSPATSVDAHSRIGPFVSEVSEDSRGLGRCISAVRERWQEHGKDVDQFWPTLEARLLGEDPPPPRRVARALAHVANQVEPESNTERPRRRPLGLGVAGLFVGVALAGLWFTNSSAVALGAHRVVIGGSEFALGTADDSTVGLNNRCPGQPAVVLLNPETGLIWIFDEPTDGARGRQWAVVPGSTGLEVEETGSCPTVSAVGPAGRSRLNF